MRPVRQPLKRVAVTGALAVALAIGAGAACDSSPSEGTDVPASPTPVPSRPPIPIPPIDVPPSPFPLTVACTARPRAGDAPLRVDFAAVAAGGRRTYEYAWDFGDGSQGSSNPRPSHTYEAAGAYESSVTVTDRAGSASCARTVIVTRN